MESGDEILDGNTLLLLEDVTGPPHTEQLRVKSGEVGKRESAER
jgi:hypothetical protein